MLMHNRRRRNEWLAEQRAKHAYQLAEARDAQTRGLATEDQVLLINRERAADEAAETKKNRPGMMKKTTNWLFGGLEKEETKGGRLAATATASQSGPVMLPFSPSEEVTPDFLDAVEEKIIDQRRQGDTSAVALRSAGGPLDQQAQLVINRASDASRGWTEWLRGGK